MTRWCEGATAGGEARGTGMLRKKDGVIKVITDNGLVLFISPVRYE